MAKGEKQAPQRAEGTQLRDNLNDLFLSLPKQVKSNRKAFIVYMIVQALIVAVLIRSVFTGQWENVFVCFLATLLSWIPPIVERSMHIVLPTTLQIIVYIFVFCAEILGEIECYYVKYPIWDTMLHTVNGFIFAAFGFCLVDLLNRHRRFRYELSPLFLALLAFCFSMTVGVMWEFFEFAMDFFFHKDMQKDFIIQQFASVTLDGTDQNIPIRVERIVRTTVETSDGATYYLKGYLDIGIIDTMKDLLVNFVGAVVFSILGYLYVLKQGKGRIVGQFIPSPQEAGEEQVTFGELTQPPEDTQDQP